MDVLTGPHAASAFRRRKDHNASRYPEAICFSEAARLRPPINPISGLLAKNAQSFRQISIPLGMDFNRATYVLTVPQDWSIEQKTLEDSRLCAIKAPKSWTLSKAASATRNTAQYDGTEKKVTVASGDYTFKNPGATQSISISGDGWIVDATQKEALAAEGWRLIDARNMKFVGTGGAAALEANGDVTKIVERLAKSGAKAVAYS